MELETLSRLHELIGKMFDEEVKKYDTDSYTLATYHRGVADGFERVLELLEQEMGEEA